MQRIRYGYELCPDHIRAGVVNYNKGSMEFENGSRIVSATTTGNTGRGMSIILYYTVMSLHLLIPSIADEFWTLHIPTLATGGSAIITSTSILMKIRLLTYGKNPNKYDENGNEQAEGVNGSWLYSKLGRTP